MEDLKLQLNLFMKNINEAANDVRDSVSRILENLPKDSDPPEILKLILILMQLCGLIDI